MTGLMASILPVLPIEPTAEDSGCVLGETRPLITSGRSQALVSEVMRNEGLFADRRPRDVQQMAMVSEDQHLALPGEASQRPEDVSDAPVVGGNQRVVQHERHLRMGLSTDVQRRQSQGEIQLIRRALAHFFNRDRRAALAQCA